MRFQRTIEQVYWNHRIWPKENKSAKPSLDTVLPEASLRARVEDYLEKSSALAEEWRHPITPEQLQAEMNRMARTSRKPDVLRELFAALGNDPYVIAECLARPILADRLIHNWYAFDSRFHGSLKQQAESELRQYGSASMMRNLSGTYTETRWALRQKNDATTDRSDPSVITLEPVQWQEWTGNLRSRFAVPAGRPGRASGDVPVGTLSPLKEDEAGFSVTIVLEKRPDRVRLAAVHWEKQPFDSWWAGRKQLLPVDLAADTAVYDLPAITAASCTDDTWTAIGLSPSSRHNHTAVWTGSEMIVWGGEDSNLNLVNSGGRYNPATDTWTATSSTAAPGPRRMHTAIWTGSLMIVWGGYDNTFYLNSGGRYDPSTDTWSAPTSVGVPEARMAHTAVWTGSLMIVWGGFDDSSVPVYLNSGGRYNPSNDTWLAMNTASAPTARDDHAAIWAGTKMIVWGGTSAGGSFNTGGLYDPSNDTWTATSSTNAPAARFLHTAVWTGSQMIVWGGLDDFFVPFNSGGRYDPSTDTWTSTSTTAAPVARAQHSATWTGTKMIVWGGYDGFGPLNTGSRYDPTSDTWSLTSTVAAPDARYEHTAVWTGSELVVWGGRTNSSYLDTGGRYNPSTDTWTSTSIMAAPAARVWHTAVWTGSQMIVWGGFDGFVPLKTGGLYDPSTNTWSPTSTTTVPDARYQHTAVWTGSQMIVWGGFDGVSVFNTGGLYDPSTDTWTPTRASGTVPASRYLHTAVWTGSQMIVWSGSDLITHINTGGLYDPSTDGWMLTSTTGAPAAREGHTSVWSGSEMIVWGGFAPAFSNTGGRYDPSTDTWTATSTTGAPDSRTHHAAVWTGSQMIVWGGYGSSYFNTGGLYDPSTDTWTTTSTTGAPVARYAHTAIWTGTQMIVWGGYDSLNDFGTGGRYDPSADTWKPTSLVTAPDARYDHTAVWTGSEMMVWGGQSLAASSLGTGGSYCALPPLPCLFCDDFEDGVLAGNWTYIKPAWSETGGDLIGTPAGKKAIAVATPAFAGCQVCSVEATMQSAGGIGNQVVLLGWYVDKKNTMELMMKQDSGKWILKELSNGKTVAKGKGIATILPNVSYDAIVQFDGTQFIIKVDGSELLRMTPVAAVPTGTVGFQVKSTTAHFGEIIVN